MSEAKDLGIVTDADLEKRAIYEGLDGKRVALNPEIPMNHKWFIGEFHTASWGSDQSPYKGESKDRVRVSMMGKKLNTTVRNSIASVYGMVSAVINEEDRGLIGQNGWWRTESLSHSSKKNTRRGKV